MPDHLNSFHISLYPPTLFHISLTSLVVVCKNTHVCIIVTKKKIIYSYSKFCMIDLETLVNKILINVRIILFI